jgi:hypothetical protein
VVDGASSSSCLIRGRSCSRERVHEAPLYLPKGCASVADGDCDQLHLVPILLEGRKEGGGVFSVFLASLSSHSKSRHNSISTFVSIQFLRSKVVGSECGLFENPLA